MSPCGVEIAHHAGEVIGLWSPWRASSGAFVSALLSRPVVITGEIIQCESVVNINM